MNKDSFRRVLVLTIAGMISIAAGSTFAAEDKPSRPSLYLSSEEAAEIASSWEAYPLFRESFERTKTGIEKALTQPIDVPGPGEGGGYEHERHKQNYNEMRDAGILFRVTGEEKYARFVRDILDKYAVLYPTLGPHPFSSSRRGPHSKLFHQALNESVWMVNTSIAYDCVYDWLSEPDRQRFEKNIFRPMVDWFENENPRDLDRIHNHGTWAVAATGMMGYMLGDQELVDKCLYGTENDGTGGFLKQLDLLFSPDGYYEEGPYYARYALRPFYLFAEAIERNQPELKIYERRDQILKKAFYSAAQTIFPNGVFPPINDASRTMSITNEGLVIANNLVYFRYGADPNLLAIAGMQRDVIPNRAGLAVARDLADLTAKPELGWGSVEMADGPDGTEGGLGILRMGKGMDQTMLLMKYGAQGGGHGHYDKLHFILFDHGNEVIPDYGYARWVNVEPKHGGRYLDENNTYAKHTIAHNTVVVDQKTQGGYTGERRPTQRGQGRPAGGGGGQRGRGSREPASRHFFDAASKDVQVMSARADSHYPGVRMQRTMFLIRDPRLEYPVVIDLFRATSDSAHVYDYPIHFDGQLITTNVEYEAKVASRVPVGKGSGYQHIWEEARGRTDGPTSVTWQDGNRYYTTTSAGESGTEVIFGRTGANDPEFNLRSEPMFILRRQSEDILFASVIEPHGFYQESTERSLRARPTIDKVTVVGHTDEGSVIEVSGANGLRWQLSVNNGMPTDGRKQIVLGNETYAWKGNFLVNLDVGSKAP